LIAGRMTGRMAGKSRIAGRSWVTGMENPFLRSMT